MLSRLFLVLGLTAGSLLARETRVLLVDIDDVGWDLMHVVPTPNLDRLAEQGRVFTNFHTQPVCSTTRARLLLGAYGSRPEVLCGAIVRNLERYEVPLRPFQPLPALVRSHGHTVAKVGKWHLAPRSRLTHPNEAGWTHYSGVLGNPNGQGVPDDHGYYLYDKVTDGLVETVSDRYLTIDETDDAVRLVEIGIDLISVSYHAPHRPVHLPPAEYWYEGKPQDPAAKIRAALFALDAQLGRLLAAAEVAGYTVFVFSDNGSAGAVGGDKKEVAFGGVFVPLWVHGPGVVPGVDRALVDVTDLYATVTDLFGIQRHLPSHQGPDSISFARRLAGQIPPVPRTLLYADGWPGNGKDPRFELKAGQFWRRAARTEEWSLLIPDEETGEQLFHRKTDPREEEDLLARGPLEPRARAARRFLRRLLSGRLY